MVTTPRPWSDLMSAAILIVLGLILCFAGARSVRLAVLASGFGAAWLLANVFGASLVSGLLIALAGAAAALVLTLVMSKVVMFIAGCIVGAVVGAKLFVALAGSDTTWLLAAFFVPSAALVSGFLAARFQRRFLVWATAFAGAGVLLSGVALLGGGLDLFRRPDTGAESTLLAVTWVALALLGRSTQRRNLTPHG
jgi:hypothetical protein